MGCVLALLLAAGAHGSPALKSSAALAKALGPAGRAEATLRYGLPAAGGVSRVVHATLTLEPPARARIDVPATGEKIVARADGGEWLQPSTRQLVRFRAQQAAPALRWWRVLLAADPSARERPLGDNRYVVSLPEGPGGVPADSAEVWLDARGLPARLIVPAGDPDGAVYRLGGWRFMRARGEAAFRLIAPKGYEAVDLP
jgi:hypothetical protein